MNGNFLLSYSQFWTFLWVPTPSIDLLLLTTTFVQNTPRKIEIFWPLLGMLLLKIGEESIIGSIHHGIFSMRLLSNWLFPQLKLLWSHQIGLMQSGFLNSNNYPTA